MRTDAWRQYALTGTCAVKTCVGCGATTKQPHRDRWWFRWISKGFGVGRRTESRCQACGPPPEGQTP